MLGCICAIEELSVEELHSNHGKDEKKEDVHNENVGHILERDHDTVEHSLERGNAIYHL